MKKNIRAVKKSTATKKQRIVKAKRAQAKIFEVDGFAFTQTVYEAYLDFKLALKEGIIKNFDLPQYSKAPQKGRSNAKKCSIDSMIFDSIMEGRYYLYLLKKKKAGKIKDFSLKKKYVLQESYKSCVTDEWLKDIIDVCEGTPANGPRKKAAVKPLEYECDYVVELNNGTNLVIDIKGQKTVDFKIKKKIFDYLYLKENLLILCLQWHSKEKKWLTLEEIAKLNREAKKLKLAKQAGIA